MSHPLPPALIQLEKFAAWQKGKYRFMGKQFMIGREAHAHPIVYLYNLFQ